MKDSALHRHRDGARVPPRASDAGAGGDDLVERAPPLTGGYRKSAGMPYFSSLSSAQVSEIETEPA